MTPFQQFRLWLRRAAVGERVSATIAAAVVLALLVWVAVPAGKTSSTGLRTNGGNGNTSAASNAAAGTSETVPGASANAGAAGGTATGGTSAGREGGVRCDRVFGPVVKELIRSGLSR